MTRFLRKAGLSIQALAGIALLSASTMVGTALAETPFPTINEPSDKSLKCIHDEDEMRKNHMNYIMHERDETMYEGVRQQPGSLAECIDCHVEPNEKGEIAGIESKEHFCVTCHEYTSVQIDCFQCHADRPQKFINRGGHSSSIKQQLELTLANANKGIKTHSTEGVNK